MINGIFTIISEGKTGRYYAESFAELTQVLPLLWSVHTARDRVPELQASDAVQLLSYSKRMAPICTTPSLRLFQPLEPERFTQLREDLLDGDTTLCHYTLDYDGNRFAMTSWSMGCVGTLSAPMDCVLSACAGAHKVNPAGRTYFDSRMLSRAFQDVMEVQRAPESQEPSGPALRM